MSQSPAKQSFTLHSYFKLTGLALFCYSQNSIYLLYALATFSETCVIPTYIINYTFLPPSISKYPLCRWTTR